MTSIICFKIGKLLLRYLEVPLVSRKLSFSDCGPLIDKILAKVNGWSTRHLSYAGRLQLIKAVPFSIQAYWCMGFLLPKAVLKRVSQICVRFFREGRDCAATGARVFWQLICSPKSEGGLGLKDPKVWNRACIL